MRPWRASGASHSSSTSSTIRISWRSLVVAIYNRSRRRILNFVLRFDGPKSLLLFNCSTRDSAMIWLLTASKYATVWLTFPGRVLPRMKNMEQPSFLLLWNFPATAVVIVLFPAHAAPTNRSTFGYHLVFAQSYILYKVCFLVFSKHRGRSSLEKSEGFNPSLNSS